MKELKKIFSWFFVTLLFFSLSSLNAFALPPAGYEYDVIESNPNPFSDTDINSLEGKAARYLYKNAIIGGFPDGEFKGDRYVNRAELAKFLLLTYYASSNHIEPNYSTYLAFSDMLLGEWYVPYVNIASSKGIINGYPDGIFKPGQNVNTVEFLKMVTLMFKLPENLPYKYQDVDDGTWYKSYAGVAEKYNLFPNRKQFLKPAGLLTRNEVAVAFYQLLSKKSISETLAFNDSEVAYPEDGYKIPLIDYPVDNPQIFKPSPSVSFSPETLISVKPDESNNTYKIDSQVGNQVPVPFKKPVEPVKQLEPVKTTEEKNLDESIVLITSDADITEIIGDEKRKNIYALAENINQLFVINEETMDLQNTITIGSKPRSIVISKDGSKAYIATAGQSAISVVDLDSLKRLDDIKLSIRPHDLAISSKYLYVTHADDQWGKGVVVDLSNNKEVEEFGSGADSLYSGALLQISTDEKFLYLGEAHLSPANIYKFDIGGADPVLVTKTAHGSIGSNLQKMVLDSAGNRLFIVAGAPYSVQILRTSDLKFEGVMDMEPYPKSVAIYEKEGIVMGANKETMFYYSLDDYTLLLSEPCKSCFIEDIIVSESKGLAFILLDVVQQGLVTQGINVIDFKKLFLHQ